MDLPSRARIVVIGGGVIGCSIAYHLAAAGESDVLLLERDRLTSGTTWHAAGLMTTFGSTSETNTGIRLYSRELYARLEAETGVATGFRPVGLIEAAADRDRLEEYRRVAAFQRLHGLEVEEISPREIADLFPWARTDDLQAGFHVPGDGRVNPVDLTMSLARGARQRGVRIHENVAVTDVLTAPYGGIARVTGVRVAPVEERAQRASPNHGDVECEVVVNATGMWARELGERHGLVIPNQAAEHYYLITDTVEGLTGDYPIFEDPAAHGYYREEGGGMMVGLFEPQAAAWAVDGIPRDASFTTLPPDWERMAPFLQTAMERVPVTLEAGVRTFFCGPESFTPDLAPAVGEAPGLAGCFVAAGMNSVGILSAGGLGRVLAEWILTGDPGVDVTGFDVARFRPDQLDADYRRARTTEILGTVYAAHTPGTQLHTMRDRLRSPVHDRLVAAGGLLREVSGWEGADWYAGPGRTAAAEPAWGPAPWFETWAAEHRTIREGCGLMDMSFMAKVSVTGPDAHALLSRVSAGRLEPGRITYTQWLSAAGRIEADLTVSWLAPDEGGERFLVIASDTAHGPALDWLRRAAAAFGSDVAIEDVTRDWAQLNLQGPRSREVLASYTSEDLGSETFGFRTVRAIEVAGVEAICARITYLGELGYELYVPADSALAVWDALAADDRVALVGLKALASLRMEKAYRDFGHDIDNTDCPIAVGLGFAIDWDHEFTGREALAARKEQYAVAGGPPARLVQVVAESGVEQGGPLLFHAEPVLRDGMPVGEVRAASYGWTLREGRGAAVGLAFVTRPQGTDPGSVTTDWLAAGTWELDVAGVRHPCRVGLRPAYDPTSARVRV